MSTLIRLLLVKYGQFQIHFFSNFFQNWSFICDLYRMFLVLFWSFFALLYSHFTIFDVVYFCQIHFGAIFVRFRSTKSTIKSGDEDTTLLKMTGNGLCHCCRFSRQNTQMLSVTHTAGSIRTSNHNSRFLFHETLHF